MLPYRVRAVNAKVKISCTQLSEHWAIALPTSDHSHISSVFANGRDDRVLRGINHDIAEHYRY